MTPWCPTNKFEWYKVIILSAHISGIGNNVVSLPYQGQIQLFVKGGVTNLNSTMGGSNPWNPPYPPLGIVVNLNNNESNIIYFSASASTLFIAAFLTGNLFCTK